MLLLISSMKKIIVVIVLFLIAGVSVKAASLYKKKRDAMKLKIGVDSFKLPKLKLTNLFEDITATVDVSIDNFSQSTFGLSQIRIDVYSLAGKLIAQQAKPLSNGLLIQPNKRNLLPLTFLISSHHFRELIGDSGGVVNVGANYLTTNQYGINLHLKGFVEAEGFTIPIDESVVV